MFRSLRVQLILGIFVIIFGVAAIIMLSTRQEVERALIDAENRSAQNVLNLIELTVSGRYRELLIQKVRIVTERRNNLVQLAEVVSVTMERFNNLAFAEAVTRQEARDLALGWLSELDLAGSARAFALSPEGLILAHPDTGRVGEDLGQTPDLKGRPLIEAITEETDSWGYSFVIYQEAATAPQDDGRRFAYFIRIPAFDLYIGISDTIEEVERYVEVGVQATIDLLAENLQQVQVVDSGFVFIFDTDLQPVIAPPDWADQLVAGHEAESGTRFLDLFRTAGNDDRAEAIRYDMVSADGPPQTMEAYVSYFRPLGWYIVSTVPLSEIAAPARMLVERQVIIFAIVLTVALIFVGLFAYKITAPLQRLTGYARSLPEQDFTAEAEAGTELADLARRNRSEVGRLAQAFGFMEGELRDNIRALLTTTRAKERIESELNIATEIQRGLLPKIFPPFPQCREIDLHAALFPARHVGGDLFDFYFLDDRRLLFTIGDVADKGVPSALFMAITKTLVKSASTQDPEPAKMMERVNDNLSADNPSSMFVTMLIGVLDIRTGRLDYVNAGHNPPILMRAARDEVTFERAISGPAAGAMEHMPYRLFTMQLEPGDMLVTYTDGITEAMDDAHREYGNDRLLALCTDLKEDGAASIVDRVVEDVRTHAGEAEQSDDISILCLRWKGNEDGDDGPAAPDAR